MGPIQSVEGRNRIKRLNFPPQLEVFLPDGLWTLYIVICHSLMLALPPSLFHSSNPSLLLSGITSQISICPQTLVSGSSISHSHYRFNLGQWPTLVVFPPCYLPEEATKISGNLQSVVPVEGGVFSFLSFWYFASICCSGLSCFLLSHHSSTMTCSHWLVYQFLNSICFSLWLWSFSYPCF